MGLVEPPWVDKEFFDSVPFNYCDHFGDREELALICKVCKEELAYIKKAKEEGKDPQSMENVFEEVSKNFAKTMVILQKMAEEKGIDLEKDKKVKIIEPPSVKRYKIYKLVTKYRNRVEKIIKSLEYVPQNTKVHLIKMAIDALLHSRYYAQVKISRALSSRWEEQRDKMDLEIADSKTSALLAYMAIERNSRVLARLAKHKPLIARKNTFLKLSKTSKGLADLVREEFYPNDNFELNEFGCKSFNQIFK